MEATPTTFGFTVRFTPASVDNKGSRLSDQPEHCSLELGDGGLVEPVPVPGRLVDLFLVTCPLSKGECVRPVS